MEEEEAALPQRPQRLPRPVRASGARKRGGKGPTARVLGRRAGGARGGESVSGGSCRRQARGGAVRVAGARVAGARRPLPRGEAEERSGLQESGSPGRRVEQAV